MLREKFQTIVDRHYEGLWSYAAYLTGHSPETEDLTHNAFMLAFDRLSAGTEFSGDPGKWLRGVMRNLVYAWWRKKKKLSTAAADQMKSLAEDADSPLESMIKAEAQAALQRCLSKLQAKDRDLIQARYNGAFDGKKWAGQMKIALSTLRVRMFRIRQWLKTCVDGQLNSGGQT